MGRHEEAIEEINRALELDPLSLIINAVSGFVYYYAREYDRAIAQCQKTLEIDSTFNPAHVFIQWAYEQKKMYNESIAHWLQANLLVGAPPQHIEEMKQAYSMSGLKGVHLVELQKDEEDAKRTYVSAFGIAISYAMVGNADRAFEWLERAYEDRDGGMVRLNVEPRFDTLRSDPRFGALLKKVGFQE